MAGRGASAGVVIDLTDAPSPQHCARVAADGARATDGAGRGSGKRPDAGLADASSGPRKAQAIFVDLEDETALSCIQDCSGPLADTASLAARRRKSPEQRAGARCAGGGEVEVQLLSAEEAQQLRPSLRAQNRELVREIERIKRLHEVLLPPLPSYWTNKKEASLATNGINLFDVPLDSPAAQTLLSQWAGGHLQPSQVRRIQRIENMPLWRKYWERKKEVERDFPPDTLNPANEAYWFHGAAPPVVDEIIRNGFDLRVSNQGIMGAGIYFASRSSYSLGYSTQPAHSAEDRAGVSRFVPPPRPRGKKGSAGAYHTSLLAAQAAHAAALSHAARYAEVQAANGELLMLHCRVVEGKAGKGSQAQRRPEAGCHSAITADVSPHRLICVFDNHQCYPEYCIHFTAK